MKTPTPPALVGLLAWLLAITLDIQGAAPLSPTEVGGLAYTNAFFPSAQHDPAIPSPESLLGFSIGHRAATTSEIERCLKAWAAAAPERTQLVEYARSHEGRPLHYLVVTSARNRARLAEIQSGMVKLGDPRGLALGEADRLVASLPGIAWLGYCIHGDETEGSDAALALIHHLLANRGAETQALLDDLVILIDPAQNPDGRERFLKMVAEHRGASPSVDNQSLLHAGYWPRGRVNHYLFDLNRDWIFGTQPETRGRLREVARWNPLLFVDAHGMSGEDTYLFSPPREPMNGHFPANRGQWGAAFARDQARAFDANGWVYYSGEWNEGWYPGYSDAWSVFRGAVGILYEVASIGENGVRRTDGRIQSERESIHQHLVSSMANLGTLQAHSKTRLAEFAAERRANLSREGLYANRTWAVMPTRNRSRLSGFLEALKVQGIEVHVLPSDLKVTNALDQLDRVIPHRTLPAGTLLVANRQPTAPLVATLLEFDPRMSAEALAEERREILRTGDSRLYDTTAWNLTLLHGLEAVTLSQDLPEAAMPLAALPPTLPSIRVPKPIAWVIDGADDLSVAAAGRLIENGVEVRVAEKPFKFDDKEFSRGSVVTSHLDNRRFAGDLPAMVEKVSTELGLVAVPVASGLGEGDFPDLGGRHFGRLAPPRIAVVGRGQISPNDFGSIWHLLDQQLGVRHSHLTDGDSPADLGRYNVIVLPDRQNPLPAGWREPLKEWVKSGGTLIAIGGSAGDLASRTNELTRVRRLPDVLGKLADYEQFIFREWLAQAGPVLDPSKVWAKTVATASKFPWPEAVAGENAKEDTLKKRDAWNKLFMPQGAVLAARIDIKHWLTFGTTEMLPVLAGEQAVLMSADEVETPARFGVFTPSATAVAAPTEQKKGAGTDTKKEEGKEKPEIPRAGWAALPEGADLTLRLSGLLWPEAAQRIANAAVLTREPLGKGQVILFAAPPNFRAATKGTARLLANAMIYGPGLGAKQTVQP